MYRGYLKEDVKTWEEELKLAKEDGDQDYINECIEEIEKAKAKDKPFERIKIDNDITISTLKKIARYNHLELEDYAVDGQPLENLDNRFITPEMLNRILNVILAEKSNGGFRKSVKDLFGTRSKVRFIKSKLEELR